MPFDRTDSPRGPHAIFSPLLAIAIGTGLGLSGCALIETPTQKTAQPTPLSWLTNFVSQPAEQIPGFDVESIRPAPRPVTVLPESLLEITVWDLYEPGKPYTFPVRVSARQTIEVPMLGEMPVEGWTIAEVEKGLADGYRNGEFLLNPRVLVRSLDTPLIKVQVTGAVNRPGFVELARTDLSVYAAIVSAGGLAKTAGTQVAVVRRIETPATAAAPAREPAARAEPPPQPVINSTPAIVRPAEPNTPVQRANSTEVLSVSPMPSVVRESAPQGGLFSVGEMDTNSSSPMCDSFQNAPSRSAQATLWYDITLTHDREELMALQLAEGDTVTVKSAAPPLRIGGIVNRAGAYPLPPGRRLSVWEAIELAGGIRDDGVPLNITLLHAAGEGRSARRWYLSIESYSKHPDAAPFVEPGDILSVEPTTGSRIKRAVGDLWSKP